MGNLIIRRFKTALIGCFLILALPLQAASDAGLTRSSVVVVAQPEFSMLKIQSFSWASSHANVSKGLLHSDFSVSDLIDTAINQALKKKAYAINTEMNNSLLIQYHVSLASELDNTAILLKFGLSPGLRSNDHTKDHERGTLVVELFHPELNKVVWRGAIEVFIGLEDTQQGRQKRVNKLLDEVFSQIPALK